MWENNSLVSHVGQNLLGKDYVVGDIHGCYDKLQAALDAVGFDETKDRLFSVGDLVDRGPQSNDVLDWLAKPWFFAVRGNHEQMAIDWVYTKSDFYYAENGGGWFMVLPSTRQKQIGTMFEFLPIAITVVGTDEKLYGIVHGGTYYDDWDVLVDKLRGPDKHFVAEKVMWEGKRWWNNDESIVKNIDIVYCGHITRKEVTKLGNVINVDTGCGFKDGKITVVELTKGE